MIRILHCFNALDNGGVEAFVMSVYRKIDKSKVQFDFLLRSSKRTHYWDEIEEMGGRIYSTPPFPKKAVSNYRATDKFFRENAKNYAAVHIHANSLFYMKALKSALKHKARLCIMHSHSTQSNSAIVSVVHNLNKRKLNSLKVTKLACSKAAGEWMFPDGNYQVIHNGIDTEKFRFNDEKRSLIRKELDIENQLVIGHIGRFVEAKNHARLIDIFYDYQKKNENAVLLLVGFGELGNAISQKIDQLKISDKVIMLNDRNDPHNLLQAMDVFVFPSLYEGLPISLVEAQASGVNCVVSDIQPNQEAEICKNYKLVSLNDNNSKWISAIDSLNKQDNPREQSVDLVKSEGYDISTTCKELMSIYNG
ncbi:MAG: glycosyltransferase family 1 protein [Ruminococcus sp.]|nr:glycosyltransferase family 1 protein [Ruminococcus sp.]